MTFDLVSIVFTITALQALLAGVAFFLMKANKGPRHARLLSGLFLLIAMSFIDGALGRSGVYVRYPSFAFIGNVLGLGIPGMLYLYARAVSLEDFHLRWRDLFQASPVLLVGGIALFSYHLQSYATKLAFWQKGQADNLLSSGLVTTAILILISIQIAMLVRLMTRHHAALRQVRSNTFDQSHNFLKGFGLAYAGIVVLNIIHAVLEQSGHQELLPLTEILSGVWSYLMISALILAVTLWPESHLSLSVEEAEITGFEPEAGGATTPAVSTPEESPYWNQLETSLEAYVAGNKPYLDADLSLLQLARKLGVPGRELSSYINTRLGCNFSDYIAGWRIAEAKEMLHDQGLPVTEVIYACGFNSKSVFNTHFKKQTGMTPSQWRENAAPLAS